MVEVLIVILGVIKFLFSLKLLVLVCCMCIMGSEMNCLCGFVLVISLIDFFRYVMVVGLVFVYRLVVFFFVLIKCEIDVFLICLW